MIAKEGDQEMNFSLASIYQSSKKSFPEMTPSSISFSKDGSATIEIDGEIPGTVYERSSFKQVLDKRNMNPLFQYDIRKAGFADQLYFIQEALHFGDFAGLPLKLLYGLFGLTGSILSITGFFIYLKRRKKGASQNVPFSAGKKVIWWSSATLLVTFIIALMHLFLGYMLTAAIITPLVYLTLLTLIVWAILKTLKKPKHVESKKAAQYV